MITASIVLYNENLDSLKKTVDSFLKVPIEKKLFLIDNSPNNTLENYFKQANIEYIFVGNNIGFGKAHNLILDKVNSDFHLILNPDVEFEVEVIPVLINELNNKPEVSFITPKVIYPNKEMQYVCRKHPTFFDLINRKLKISKNQIIKNEYQDHDLEKSFYPEFIHGCFMLFKTVEFKKLNGFDERYFLYAEDANGNPVENGKPGELVITSLGVEGFPLLRFRTGDVCTLYTDPCPCGDPNPRVGPVLGRLKQMIKYKGTTCYPLAISSVLDGFPEILEYQIQVSKDEFGNDKVVVYFHERPDFVLYILTDTFRSLVRFVPELISVSESEIEQMVHPEAQRKAQRFVDLRG